MKRLGYLYNKICDIDNIRLADKKARRGKEKQFGVIEFNKNKEQNILDLKDILINRTFKTSKYSVFTIKDPKEREIFKLPYFPDRIVHHAILNILEPIFMSVFTRDTYSCIKKRGIHGAMRNVKIALKDTENTKYCLKLDIRKFYPSINHNILKQLLRRKFKDKDLLSLLDEIIDSTNNYVRGGGRLPDRKLPFPILC